MSTYQQIPFFPLSLFKLPGEELDLHVFELRYRQLVEELLNDKVQQFGIPISLPSKEKNKFGCLARIKKVHKKYPDGRYDIRVEITGFFKVIDFQEKVAGRLYAGGQIEEIPFDPMYLYDPALMAQMNDLKHRFSFVFTHELSEDMTDVELLSKLPIPDEEKFDYIFLANDWEARNNFIAYQLRRLEVILMQQHAVYKGLCLN